MNISKMIKIIQDNKTFLLSTHLNPDPDGLCSELAFMHYLKSIGKKVIILNHDNVPARYDFIPFIKKMKSYSENFNRKFDAVIVIDCGDLNRIGKVKNIINNKPVINIDHHITNEKFGHYNLVDSHASSTTEVIYDFFNEIKFKLTKVIAMYLYIGIMTDTGSFRHENTTKKAHIIAGNLLEFGFSVPGIYKNLYDNIPLEDLKMFVKIISNFNTYKNDRVVCLDLKKKVSEKVSEEFDLRDTIFKFLRSIKGVDVIIIFSEYKKDRTKVNFRSSSSFNVAKLASHFGGGGHKKASGCIVRAGMKESKELILKEVFKEI